MVVAGAIMSLVIALLLLIYLCAEVKAERRAKIAMQETSKNGEPKSSSLDAATLFGIAATHEYLRRTSDSDDDSWDDSSSYDSDYDYDAQEDFDDYDEFDDDMSWINGTY